MFTPLFSALLPSINEVDLSSIVINSCLSDMFINVCLLDNLQDLVKSIDFGHFLISEVSEKLVKSGNKVSSESLVLLSSLSRFRSCWPSNLLDRHERRVCFGGIVLILCAHVFSISLKECVRLQLSKTVGMCIGHMRNNDRFNKNKATQAW